MTPGASRSESHALLSHEAFVRTQLRRLGVSCDATIADLMQDVWLVALTRSPAFANDRAARAWLAQVCRRIVANHRRHNARLTSTTGETGEIPVHPEQLHVVERGEDRGLCALSALDSRKLDVLILYSSGALSMREIAELTGEQESTVYARYRAALKQVAAELTLPTQAQARRVLRAGAPTHIDSSPTHPARPGPGQLGLARGRNHPLRPHDEHHADVGGVLIYRDDADLVLLRTGNVVVARRLRRLCGASSACIASALSSSFARLRMPMVLVNCIDADVALPNVEERRTLFHQVSATKDKLLLTLDIAPSDALYTRTGAAIMDGIMSLTRAYWRFPLAVVSNVDDAEPWVGAHGRSLSGPVPWATVRRVIETTGFVA